MPKPRTTPRKPIPTFRSEDEERAFWAAADTSEFSSIRRRPAWHFRI